MHLPIMLDYSMPSTAPLLLCVDHLHVKGGRLSIATQGSYWFSSPHPLALSTASRPGIPTTAETSSRAGTRGRRVPASNQTLQEHISRYGPALGATRLEVGPRESRAGSRVPRHTSRTPTSELLSD